MDTFYVTAQIVLPTFLLIALGYLLKLVKIIDPVGCQKMNELAFKIFIPMLVFYNIFSSDLKVQDHLGLAIYAFVAITIIFVGLMIFIPVVEKNNKRRGVMIQGIYRSSFLLLGLGLVTSMYGTEKSGVTAMLATVVATMFSIYAVIALEYFGSKTFHIKKMLMSIIKNPLIIATIIAIVFKGLHIELGVITTSVVSQLAELSTPFALIVLGASFSISQIGDRKKQLFISCMMKLVILPLIFVPISVMLGFRNEELMTLLVLFGAPNAVSSHLMATNAGGDGDLAGQIVVFTTTFSIISLFIFIFCLISMGYL